ncbi:MAG: sulfatase [Verrucomicrobiota bacterium]
MSPLPALALLLFLSAAAAAATPRPPNFVIILADDLGWGDLSSQGSTTIATPRLDGLAREGARFTSAYSAAPFCSPSRAALLTGRLPARAGLPYVLFPTERHGLPEAEVTLATLLKARGYATACIGKWHLGWAAPFRPGRHGFDEYFGLPHSNDSNAWPVGEPFIQVMGVEPLPLIDGERVVEAPVDQSTLSRRYTERAVAFIRANRDRPFLLYLPHTMPHIPQYASPEFAGKSRGGLYGDTVEEIDAGTGVILDTLRELGLERDTVVFFSSDNGAPGGRGNAAAAGKGGAVKAKGPAKAPRFPGRSLAGSNGPLRAGKGTTWEGGIRVPLLVRWPGGITPGRVVDEPVSLLDVFPTCARLAGAAPPADRVIDGRDLSPWFTGDPAPGGAPRALVHYFGLQPQAIREGRWKLLLAGIPAPDPRPLSLWWEHLPALFTTQHRVLAAPEWYDLAADPGEQENLAARQPEVVRRLAAAAGEFDAALQRDRRPLQVVPGPASPPPGAIRPPPAARE